MQDNKYGSVNVHVQLPTKNVDELIKMMDYDKENHCVFKEGFASNIVKTECHDLWVKPAYVKLTPDDLQICDRAEESTCHTKVNLCEVSHVYTPTNWQTSPCFQVMGKEKTPEGHHKVLAQICANDYPAAMGWQQAILSYHRCKEGMYTH